MQAFSWALLGPAMDSLLIACWRSPAKALRFNWSFVVTESSDTNAYGGQTISGAIDGLRDCMDNQGGTTARVSSSPFGPDSSNVLQYAGGSGICVVNGVVDESVLQAFLYETGMVAFCCRMAAMAVMVDPWTDILTRKMLLGWIIPPQHNHPSPHPPPPPRPRCRHRFLVPVEAADCIETEAGSRN